MTVNRNLTLSSKNSQGNITEVEKYVSPICPAAAQAVRASGEVVVLAKIDNDGKVISSKAENGHPLLKKVSELAAKDWIFSVNENLSEREERLVFSFLQTKKETISSRFTKPNRITIFCPVSLISTSSSY